MSFKEWSAAQTAVANDNAREKPKGAPTVERAPSQPVKETPKDKA